MRSPPEPGLQSRILRTRKPGRCLGCTHSSKQLGQLETSTHCHDPPTPARPEPPPNLITQSRSHPERWGECPTSRWSVPSFEFQVSSPPADGLAIEKIQTCLARVLPEVRPKADAIILLAHTDESTLTALASEFYELSLVLGGRVSQPAKALLRENRTLIHYTGNEGKSFGFIQLTFPPKSGPQIVHSDIVLLSDRFPENPTVLAAAASYRREIRQSPLDIDLPDRVQADQIPGRRQAPAFAGSESCRPCHAAAFDVWQRSAHSHAFESLAQRDSDADPACIRCHTVGFGSPGGYRREMARTRLTDVGCESCHGPGGTHVAERQAGTPPNFHFRPLAAGDCTRCHQGEFSRPFNWDRLWPAIRH